MIQWEECALLLYMSQFCFVSVQHLLAKKTAYCKKKLKHAFIFYDTEDLDCNSELPEKCKYTGYCSLGS